MPPGCVLLVWAAVKFHFVHFLHYLTRNYQWPPATMATDEKAVEDLRNHERQTSELEKQSILEFEGYLAAATTKKTITTETSLLITQLTAMDPT